jgi:hypothetical protein
MPRTSTGLLTIRIWHEPGSTDPLRVHVRSTSDVSEGFQHDLNFANAEAVGVAVQEWLRDFQADDALEV